MLHERNQIDGIASNPNNIITNLSNHTLSNAEYNVLNYGPKYGISFSPKSSTVLAYIWDQIRKSDIYYNNEFAKMKIKNALRSYAFNLIDIDDKNIFKDASKIKIIKHLRKTLVIMKPDKGNDIVLLNKEDYTSYMENLFTDKTKFKQLDSHPTITRLSSLQSYLHKLKNNNEITEAQFQSMRPQNARPEKATGLPKAHKQFNNLPSFRPIIDTTGSAHYLTENFLANLLKPLTTNQFNLDDSFYAAKKIKNIPKELFDCNYKYVSFDAVSLFTNVQLSKSINIILKRVYQDRLIKTNLKKRSLKKLLVDACTKTSFIFNNEIYEQKDGISMGSQLGPVLANTIMTELEEKVIKKFIDDGTIKFYGHYICDTLLVIKPKDIGCIHQALNKFDKNLRFTVNKFDDVVPHFLDLELRDYGIALYTKPANTGLYVDYNSNVPWAFRVSWIKSLTVRAKNICSAV